MDEMLALLGSHKPCMLFESIFPRCMPEDIRLQLATSSFDDLRALAKTADEFWQAKEQSAVVFASNTRTNRSATRKPATTTSSGESPAIIIILNLFIERHIQRAVRGAAQHSKAALSVIVDIQVNYYFKNDNMNK